MNGAHDMGGMQGFGPVQPEANEPLFHADWERRVMRLTLAMGATGMWNIDMSRRARETRSPADYLAKSYYELWLAGLEALIVETGLAAPDEIESGSSKGPAAPVKQVLTADKLAAALAAGSPSVRAMARPPRFNVGDRVRTRELNPATHIRLPRYVRGRQGTVHLAHGAHVLPDANAHGRGESPEHLYTIRFAATELWGPDTTASEVLVDCWDSYLEGV